MNKILRKNQSSKILRRMSWLKFPKECEVQFPKDFFLATKILQLFSNDLSDCSSHIACLLQFNIEYLFLFQDNTWHTLTLSNVFCLRQYNFVQDIFIELNYTQMCPCRILGGFSYFTAYSLALGVWGFALNMALKGT